MAFGQRDQLHAPSGKEPVENCVIRNHTSDGIFFGPPGPGNFNLSVSNTLVADNGGSGISVLPLATGSTVSTVKAVFNRVEVYNNSFHGIVVTNQATGSIKATVADSAAANNSLSGFRVLAQPGAGATSLMVIRSVGVNNDTGISATGSTATLRVGQSTVTGNTTSWSATTGAVLRSYGDNNIDGNGDGDPAIPPPILVKK